MSVTNTKALAAGEPTVTNTPVKAGVGGRAAALRTDAAVAGFQVQDYPDQDQAQQQGGEEPSGNNLGQRRPRGLYRDEFTPLINRAASYVASEPQVGGESGPTVRVFFADVVRGVRSYEFSMLAIAANDRSTGLQRGSHYSRYF